MSELDDFVAEGLEISEEIMGGTPFTLDGRPFVGVVNEFEGEQEAEIGGMLVSCNATIIARRPQFRCMGAPLTRVLKAKLVEIDGLTYSVARVANDAVSVTLGLVIAT